MDDPEPPATRFPAQQVLGLTLPGAVLWSIPLGLLISALYPAYFGLSRSFAFAGGEPLFFFLLCLMPISAITSFLAMRFCRKASGPRAVVITLYLFNFLACVSSATCTLITAFVLSLRVAGIDVLY